MSDARETIARDELIFDSALIEHGFVDHMRDYDLMIEVPAATPGGEGSYIEVANRLAEEASGLVHDHAMEH